jgi:hypothetical protein
VAVRFDGADWSSGGAGCYPMGEEYVGFFYEHMVRRGSQNSPQYTFTLKIATAMFAKMLVNIQHFMWLTPKS